MPAAAVHLPPSRSLRLLLLGEPAMLTMLASPAREVELVFLERRRALGELGGRICMCTACRASAVPRMCCPARVRLLAYLDPWVCSDAVCRDKLASESQSPHQGLAGCIQATLIQLS